MLKLIAPAVIALAAVGLVALGYWQGYEQGRYGDQAWHMRTTDGNTVIGVGWQAELPYEWRYTVASGGIFKVYRNEEDARQCIRRIDALLQKVE